jgi:hypothetical protein
VDTADSSDESSSSDTEEGSERKKEKWTANKKTIKKWNEKWLTKFHWLYYENEKMFCRLCIKQNKKNKMTNGCKNFRSSCLERHVKSATHREAVNETVNRKDYKKAAATALDKKDECITKCFRSVYWLVKERMPLSKYKSMYEFLKMQGVNLQALKVHGDDYSSRTSAQGMLDSIVYVVVKNVEEILRKAEFLSVLIDESTDICVNKKLVIYVKSVDAELNVRTTFIGNYQLEEIHVTAEVLFNQAVKCLMERGVDLRRLIGFGSDGATIMTGLYFVMPPQVITFF